MMRSDLQSFIMGTPKCNDQPISFIEQKTANATVSDPSLTFSNFMSHLTLKSDIGDSQEDAKGTKNSQEDSHSTTDSQKDKIGTGDSLEETVTGDSEEDTEGIEDPQQNTKDSESDTEDKKPRYKNSRVLEESLNVLFQKKGPTREKALSLVVDVFTNSLQHKFVKSKGITLLYVCLNSIKKGSNKEKCLASHVIGLLSITVGCTNDLAHEILEESFSALSQALQSTKEPLVISSLLGCLAIVTFVGANGPEESERSMQVIWQVVARKPTSQILKSAISAWSFLLATIESWNVNPKIWKGAICQLTSELENDNISVRIAVGETLALMFELGNIVKFYSESERYPSVEELKETILTEVRNLSTGDGGSADKLLTKSHRVLFRDLSKFLTGGRCPETTVKIGRNLLKISTWSQTIQVNFLKSYLGSGFVKHVQENELLHDFLDIKRKGAEQLAGGKEDMSSDEEVGVHYICRVELEKKGARFKQRAKTQLLNKKRSLSHAKDAGHYSASLTNEDY